MNTHIKSMVKSFGLMLCAVVIMLAIAGCGNNQQSSNATSSSSQSTSSKKAEPTNPLDNYSWDELSNISKQIAAAPDENGAIDIAKQYGLCSEEGTLDGSQKKTVTLSDGTKTAVCIIGFNHDVKTGGGKAGITFMFTEEIASHQMNPTDTNKGGWKDSGMRSFLASQLSTLPSDLQNVIVEVDKLTNNSGRATSPSSVTTTSDKLWLLAAAELWGKDVGIDFNSYYESKTGKIVASIYNKEGNQYKAFIDVDKANDAKLGDNFVKRTESSYWWLRSPDNVNSDMFKCTTSVRSSHSQASATGDFGAVPCFCI